jgi:hypothetical protein
VALRDRRGQALAMVLAAVVCALALLGVRMFLGESDFSRARHVLWHNEATYAAEGGLELALLARQSGNSDSWIFDVGGHDVAVVELDGGEYMSELRATAKVGDVTVVKSLFLRPLYPRSGHP